MRGSFWIMVIFMAVISACGGAVCGCGAGGDHFVQLSDTEKGGSVEVCFEGDCGFAEIDDADGTADEVQIMFSSLEELEERLADPVKVSVRVIGRDGLEARSSSVTPVAKDSCCGVFWTADFSG